MIVSNNGLVAIVGLSVATGSLFRAFTCLPGYPRLSVRISPTADQANGGQEETTLKAPKIAVTSYDGTMLTVSTGSLSLETPTTSESKTYVARVAQICLTVGFQRVHVFSQVYIYAMSTNLASM